MFHRLGSPSCSSNSTGIVPACRFSSGRLPSLSRFNSTSSIASDMRSSVVTPALCSYLSPRSIVVPPGWEGELREDQVDNIARRQPAEEATL
jgi:hypothetical protein